MLPVNHEKKYPSVSIIILNWNNFEDTQECLLSLNNINYNNYSVVLIDNGSKDKSGVLLSKLGLHNIYIQNKFNKGFSAGNNVGIAHALNSNSDYVLLLNNDTVVDDNFLQLLVQFAERDRRIGIVGPKIVLYDDPTITAHGAGFINWIRGSASFKDMSVPCECDFVTGACLLIKSKVFKELRELLDEEYFLYWEETDLCVKAKKKGFKSYYYPKAKLRHKVSQSTKSHIRSKTWIYNYMKSRIIFMKRNTTGVHKWSFIFLYIVFGMPLFVLRALLSMKRSKRKEICVYLSASIDGLISRPKSVRR